MPAYIDNLKRRYATKKFDSSFKLTSKQEDLLDQALLLAPSSFGLQPYKFVKVTDPEVRKKLRAVAWDQAQVTDASVLYVLCARSDVDIEMINDFIKLIVEVRGVDTSVLDGYKKMMEGAISAMSKDECLDWAKKQVYITLGFLLDAAAQNGLDACPMEGFDSLEFAKILEIEADGLVPTVICPVGIRAKDDEIANYKKVRQGKEQIMIVK